MLASPRAALRAPHFVAAEIYGVSDRWLHRKREGRQSRGAPPGPIRRGAKIKMVFVDGQTVRGHEPEKPKDAPKGNISGKWKLTTQRRGRARRSTVDLEMASEARFWNDHRKRARQHH